MNQMLVFFFIIEFAFALTENFGHFDNKPGCQFNIAGMTSPGGTAGNRCFCRNSHTHAGSRGGCCRLKNAVDMVDTIAVGCDILSRNGKHNRELTGGDGHDIQQVFTNPKNIAFFTVGEMAKPRWLIIRLPLVVSTERMASMAGSISTVHGGNVHW